MALAKVVWVTESLQTAALKLFEKRPDKEYRFTGCTSFVLMDVEAIPNHSRLMTTSLSKATMRFR